MTFSRIFKPKHNYLLERIGKENDGGYLINPNAILKSDYLLSIGIFDDWSFERYPKICAGEIKFPNNLDEKNNPKKKEITIRFSEI